MRLPSFKRLFKQDFDTTYQNFVDKLAQPFNQMEVLFQALSNNVSLVDNMLVTIKDVLVRVDANGKPLATTSFTVTTKGPILGVSVINVTNETNSASYPASGVTISYTQDTTTIIINHITGLLAGNSYSLKIIAWGG